MSEREELLPRRTSTTSSRKPSRSARRSEVNQETFQSSSASAGPILPAQAVADHHDDEFHDPRWAEYSGRPNALTRFRYIWREELAEMLGTSMIIFFGASVEAQTSLHYDINKGHPYSFGDYNSCRLAWAAGVACGIWIAGGVSGAHLNPSVTLALWMYRGFPGRRVLWYIGAQILGAMLASFVVYANYRYSIGLYEGAGFPSTVRTVTGPHATAGIFFTFPQPWLPASSAFLSEVVATAVLVAVVLALSDKNNLPPPKGTMAFAMFIVLIGIGASMGVNTGYSLNLGRDWGPRLALWILGYGNEIWTHNSYYFAWGPGLGALTGGLVGGFIYDFAIYTGRDSPLNRPVGGTANPKVNDEAILDESEA